MSSSPERQSRRSNSVSDRAGDETGAVTVLAAVLIGALLMTAVAGVWLAAAVVARHRAQSAADLAALAAAAWVPAGETAACGHARRLARSMGASVRQCVVTRLDVTVVVVVVAGGRFGRAADAWARAGPDR